MSVQHFLTLHDLDASTLKQLIARAIDLKQSTLAGERYEPLKNKNLAMIFNKSSTRTRVSFEAGMRQLGGGAINLVPGETQIGRGEPIEDTARVISSMVDGVMIRTDAHHKIETFANHSSVPVINGLTDDYHPCQLLADIQTFNELRDDIAGASVAWIGDGNNMCHSWVNAAEIFNFELKIATPEEFSPNGELCNLKQSNVSLSNDPKLAAENVDLIVTDTWASMGQEAEKKSRDKAFAGFCVNNEIMKQAKQDALFMHCLPAYRGSEVTADVLEGKQSVIWQEAENRLHAQKALLEYLLAT